MKKILAFSACLLIGSSLLLSQKTKLTVSFIDQQLRSAATQYKTLMKQLPDDVFPRSYDSASGRLITSNSSWWCSGFYPGTLLYLYEYSKDDTLKAEAIRRLGSRRRSHLC